MMKQTSTAPQAGNTADVKSTIETTVETIEMVLTLKVPTTPAKFKATCKGCGKAIEIGQSICKRKTNDGESWQHAKCAFTLTPDQKRVIETAIAYNGVVPFVGGSIEFVKKQKSKQGTC